MEQGIGQGIKSKIFEREADQGPFTGQGHKGLYEILVMPCSIIYST